MTMDTVQLAMLKRINPDQTFFCGIWMQNVQYSECLECVNCTNCKHRNAPNTAVVFKQPKQKPHPAEILKSVREIGEY